MKKRVLSLFLAITLCLTLTPTGALAEESLPEQTVVATQETETPTPVPQKEEPTAPAENGADENAPPANPDEKPTENAPAAAEKNTVDKETGKEAAAATGRDESKADGSPSDDDAAKVQNQLVMAAAAGPDEPTMMGQNNLLAPADEGQTPANAQNSEGGGIYVPPGSTTEGSGGIYVSEGDTQTEIWCVGKPTLIQRSYDGTTDGDRIPIDLTFTDGTNEIKLKEGTGFTSKKTFDSADAGRRTVTVEIELIGDAAAKYKLKAGEETFTIGGYIDKAIPELTVSLSKAACTVGEKLLPLLSVEGAPEGAAVTYYYTQYKSIAGDSDYEGNAIPAIDESTAISSLDEEGNNTYYIYAKTGETTNYKENRSATVALTVNEAVVEAASVTKADGTERGTYASLPAALNAAQDGDTVKLLADHVTDADALNALGEDFTFEQYASIVPVVTKTLTLDLNHKTVDYLEVGFSETNEETQEKETLATGNLTVTSEAAYGRILNLLFMAGALDIRGGEIGGILVDDNGVESPDGGLVCDVNSGNATISNGIVYGLTVLEGAAVTVKNGFNHRGRWSVDSGGTLSITGSTFKDVQFVNSGTIAISGGTFEEISNNDTNTPQPLMLLLAKDCAFVNKNNTSDVQDGTKTSLTEVMVKEHTHTFENGKCACGVKAIITDNNVNYYSTLQAALDAAANDNTITSVTLGQDLTEDVTFNGSAAGALTLNMNGHKLEATAGVPLTVIGGELIIEGAGQVNQNTASNAAAFPAISLTGGKLVIKGDLSAQGGYDSSNGRKPAIRAEEEGELDLQGNVSLNGGLTILGNAKLTNLLTKGTFYAQDPNGNATKDNVLAVYVRQEVASSDNYNTVLKLIADGYAIYKADGTVRNAATFTLNSDTYSIGAHTCNYTQDETNGIAFCKCGRSHAHRDLSEEKSVLVNGVCPICGYHCPHKNIGDDGVCTDCKAKMVAKVTVGEMTTYTADLADALNKAANGTTITLLVDTEISAYVNIYDVNATGADQMVVTLDLAGHTVTSSCKPIVIGADRDITASYYGTLKIVGTGNITLEYAALNAGEKGVLDLTDWTGGSISSVTVTRNGNTNEEGKLIVGKDAGRIGSLAFYNWPSAEITNTKLYGGSYGEITTTGSGTPSLAGLLPNGCAFKNADGRFANATVSKLYNVTVSACDHGGKNGFDKDAATCPYCNAPAVAETALNNGEGNRQQRRFADLQTAIDADRDGGAEFKLLTDVTGDYTINGTQDTALDLYGHSIKGTVTVKGIKGDYITTTLSNTKNTTTVSIDKVVAFDGAELAGSQYPAVIGELTLAEGAKWNNILNGTALGYKVLNTDGTHKWYAQDDVKVSQLNNVIINRLPITTKTLNLKVDGKNLTGSSPKVERGTTVQLCASCNAKDANVSIYIGEIDGNNEPKYSLNKAKYQKIGTAWYYVVELDANKIGTYDIYFTATKDGYTVTSTSKKLTVTKPNLSNAEITFPNGNEAAFNYVTATGVPTFVVTYKGQTLEKDVDFTITSGDSFSGVGPCTLTIKATDNGDYTGSKSAKWTVRPLKVAASVGDSIKTYDGTTNLPENTKITFKSADSYYTGATLRLAKGTDYEVLDAKYDSADASETEKTISFTIKLKNKGYVFEDGTKEKAFTLKGSETDKTFKIDKATIASDPQLYQTVFNDLAKTYEIDLNQVLYKILPEGGKYGNIVYGKPGVSMYADYYPVGGANIENGKLRLSINKAASFKQGKEIGTVAVEVETTNYQPFTLTIHVSVQDKLVPVPAEGNSVSATDITYGKTLADSKLTVKGTMQDRNTREEVKGTFAWTNKDFKPDASDSYEAEWTFTPAAGYEEYATVTGTVTIKVKPAKLTVSVNASRMYYTGEEQIASIIASGQSVDSTPVTFTYSDKVDGNYTSGGPTFTDAGTYTVYYKAEAANHEPATGTFPVTIDPLPISLFSVSSISKTYDGSADVALTADKLMFFSNTTKAMNIKLPNTALTFSDAQFTSEQADGSYLPSPEVGNGKALSFTMTLTSSNYVFEGKSEGTVSDVFATDDVNRFTITKAAAPTNIPSGTLNIINGTHQTYTYDFSQLLPKLTTGEYGTISYGNQPAISLVSQSGYYYDGTIVEFHNGVLTLAQFYAKDGTMTGQIGTVKVTVTTTNYEDFQLTLVLNAINKIKPTPNGTITASNITYGQALSDSSITGKMKDPNTGATVNGTFAWKDGTIQPDANDRYEAEWTFTPVAPEYATVTGKTTVKVAPKSIEGATITLEKREFTYNAAEQSPKITDVTLEGWSETITYHIVGGDKATNANDSITLTIEGTGNYTGKAAVKWKITPREVTPAIEVASCTYTGDALEPTVTLKDGNEVIPTDEYTVEYSNNTNAGTGRVTIKDVAGGNYVIKEKTQDFTITAKEVTVAITPNGGTYGSVTAAAAVLSGVVDGETVSVTLTYTGNGYNSTGVPTDVDSYKVTASIADNNYILTGETTANFVITPKAVIVSGITAKDKAYDGTTNATLDFSNAKFDGILENDNLTVTAKGVFEKTEAGKRNVAISDLTLGGNSVANYVLATDGQQTTTTATITKKQITVTITSNGGTYGETIAPATVKANDVVGEDTPTITLTYTGTANDGTEYTGTTPPTKAGTYTVTATTTDNNYTLDAKTITAEFTVAKRRATVTPDDNQSKVYEEKDPELTYKVIGVLDGETLKGITLTRAEGENAGEYAITATADAGANPNYDVTLAKGKFTINPKPIDSATVKLGKGLIANGAEQTQAVEKVLLDDKEIPADSYTLTGNTATAPGSHTLTITAKGNYTGTVEQTYVIVPAKAADAPGEEIAIGRGKVNVDVQSEGTVPPAALLTDKAELLAMLVDSGDITADELAQIADGASVDIVLTVKEANVPDEVKTAMAQAAKDYTIGHYLDISLFKYMTVNGSQQAVVALHTTKDVLTISVVVPDALINTNSAVNRTYCIVRNHEGTITVLDAAFDAASKTLTFKTDRFSDYAIAYKDTAVPSSGSNPGSNNSSNDSETKKNEVAAPTPAPTPASSSKPSTITAMPQTGDTSNPTLYVVLLVASLLGLAVVFVCKKRNDK